MGITEWEQAEVDAANQSGKQPVVFVHGLWLLPSSWHAWRELFDSYGYATLAPGWPDDPRDVTTARADPTVFAGKKVKMVADHFAEVIAALDRKPVIIGHSFGGLLTQILAGRGLSVAAVPIDPAPHKGVLPLPISSLRGASPVLRNPANWKRAVTLTFEQFRYGFANAVPEDEGRALYDEYHVAAPGAPLFQVAVANFNPFSETKADVKQADRGPMLFVSGERDHLVPWSVTNAAFKRWNKHAGGKPTEIVEFTGRGHSLIVDHGWEEIAEKSVSFLGDHAITP